MRGGLEIREREIWTRKKSRSAGVSPTSDESVSSAIDSDGHSHLGTRSPAAGGDRRSCIGDILHDVCVKECRDGSPLKFHRPGQFAIFEGLSKLRADSEALQPFCTELGTHLEQIVGSGQGRIGKEKLSVRIGQSLLRARSSPELARIFTELVRVGAGLRGARDEDLKACLASCVTEMWAEKRSSVRVRRPPDQECQVQDASVVYVFDDLTEEQKRKVEYHAGWAVMRVRSDISKSAEGTIYQAAKSVSDPTLLSCGKEELSRLLVKLGGDVLQENGAHQFVVIKECLPFFILLHNAVRSLLSEDAFRQLRDNVVEHARAKLSCHRELRKEWERLWTTLDESVSVGTTVLLREICR